MTRNAYRGPQLPKFLLDQVHNGNGNSKHNRANVARKERRKTERQQKKQSAQPSRPRTRRADLRSDGEDDESEHGHTASAKVSSPVRTDASIRPLRSILKPAKPAATTNEISAEKLPEPTVSRRSRERLEEDDVEIAALEKKLGIKGNNSKALQQDGLDWIAGDGSDSEDEERGGKRKRPEDTKWLRDKRLKATVLEDDESDIGRSDEDEIEKPFSEDDIDVDGFDGFDSEEDGELEPASTTPRKQKENPYLPPVRAGAVPAAKYVPPSLRASATEDEEALKQLRRQIQGLLNRLAESNMISLIRSLEEIYGKNARQHVTSTLVGLLVGLVADAAVLNDSFLILHAGFAATIYKIMGTDFGAQLLEHVIEKTDQFYGNLDGKQALNLLAFLCNLYTFQVAGSPIVFDYIRLLLDELSENNTELLLRVIRNCGQTLRQDNPSALKDVVLLLQRSVAKVGEDNVSVRTKFMIETINDLKNNRMKAATSSTLAAEQTARMKKTLASLNASRSFKPTEPLSITLSDIRDSSKKGKWWLIGASYHDPSKVASNQSMTTSQPKEHSDDATYESTSGTNLNALARSQGMNTEVRRAIFVTLLSSVDAQHAHMQLLKLHLKNKQQLEIPRVLVHCVKAEEGYNPFYALVAMKFSGEHRTRKAFEFAAWDFFRVMQNASAEDGEEKVSVRMIVNEAKFFATLVVEGGLRMGILRKLDSVGMGGNEGMFLEVFLTMVLTHARRPVGKKKVEDEEFEKTVKKVFMQVAGDLGTIQGLRQAIETDVCKAEVAMGKKEKRAVEKGCGIALDALEEAARKVVSVADDTDDET